MMDPRYLCSTAYDSTLFNLIAPYVQNFTSITAVVSYTDVYSDILSSTTPVLQHISGKKLDNAQKPASGSVNYHYPTASSPLFAIPFQPQFNYNTEAVSHTRSLTFLKKLMNGPYFDLEAIWDEHTYYEFADRSVEHTMSTMVAEPYVNHVPTVSRHTCLSVLVD